MNLRLTVCRSASSFFWVSLVVPHAARHGLGAGNQAVQHRSGLQRMNDKLRQIRSLLTRHTTLVLATADHDSRPRSTPLFFIVGLDLRLYWFSSRSSLHSRNCARSPQASVAVFRTTRDWQKIRGVQMDGAVSLIRDPAVRRQVVGDYRARFGLGDRFASTIGRSALYCFVPAWVRYLDNSRGFGFKFEMSLPALPLDSSSSHRHSSGTASERRGAARAG